MQLQGTITINGRNYPRGSEVSWVQVYPFFLLHMLVFGISGFLLAYATRRPSILFLYLHGGFAIAIYTLFYITIFGRDEVKWMFINAGLGLIGIYTQLGILLSFFHKRAADFPLYVHFIPFLYFVLYSFLIRHAFTDLLRARGDPQKKLWVEVVYVVSSLAMYFLSWYLERQHDIALSAGVGGRS